VAALKVGLQTRPVEAAAEAWEFSPTTPQRLVPTSHQRSANSSVEPVPNVVPEPECSLPGGSLCHLRLVGGSILPWPGASLFHRCQAVSFRRSRGAWFRQSRVASSFHQ